MNYLHNFVPEVYQNTQNLCLLTKITWDQGLFTTTFHVLLLEN